MGRAGEVKQSRIAPSVVGPPAPGGRGWLAVEGEREEILVTVCPGLHPAGCAFRYEEGGALACQLAFRESVHFVAEGDAVIGESHDEHLLFSRRMAECVPVFIALVGAVQSLASDHGVVDVEMTCLASADEGERLLGFFLLPDVLHVNTYVRQGQDGMAVIR